MTLSRTYDYASTPLAPAEIATRDGLEIVRGMMAGTLPGSPIWQTVGLGIVEVEQGRVVCAARAESWVLNFRGSGQGGWLATLLDSAMGLAIMSTLPAGRAHTTAELSTRYVRPVLPSAGLVLVEGRVLHAGRRMATAEGDVKGADDAKLYAHGQTTCLILEIESPG